MNKTIINKMVKNKVNKAIELLNTALIDEIVESIEMLHIDDSDKELVINTVKQSKIKKRKQPRIPEEKQCGEICKNGKKCTVAKCYHDKCWAHLDKYEKDDYKMKKEAEQFLQNTDMSFTAEERDELLDSFKSMDEEEQQTVKKLFGDRLTLFS